MGKNDLGQKLSQTRMSAFNFSFNIILDKIMTDALADHEASVRIGGRTITNLSFADDIDAFIGKEQELIKLLN